MTMLTAHQHLYSSALSQFSGGRQLTFSLETGFFCYLFPSFPELGFRKKNTNYSYILHNGVFRLLQRLSLC